MKQSLPSVVEDDKERVKQSLPSVEGPTPTSHGWVLSVEDRNDMYPPSTVRIDLQSTVGYVFNSNAFLVSNLSVLIPFLAFN